MFVQSLILRLSFWVQQVSRSRFDISVCTLHSACRSLLLWSWFKAGSVSETLCMRFFIVHRDSDMFATLSFRDATKVPIADFRRPSRGGLRLARKQWRTYILRLDDNLRLNVWSLHVSFMVSIITTHEVYRSYICATHFWCVMLTSYPCALLIFVIEADECWFACYSWVIAKGCYFRVPAEISVWMSLPFGDITVVYRWKRNVVEVVNSDLKSQKW